MRKDSHHSLETRRKISELQKGRKRGPRPPEVCLAISRAKKGKSNGLEGRLKTKETKERIGLANKGQKNGMFGRTPWNKGKPMSQSVRDKVKHTFFKPKQKAWNKGKFSTLSPLKRRVRFSLTYKIWVSDILKRDNFTCQNCFSKNNPLNKIRVEVHHIKPFSEIFDEYSLKTHENAMECEELWNLNNGITLCVECHKKTETYGKRIKKNIEEKIT